MVKRVVSSGLGGRGLIGRSRRRGWRAGVVCAAAGCSALWALALAGSATAATSCGASGVFSESGATATCTYSYTGSEQTFTIPSGVGSVRVTAAGAPGATSTSNFGPQGGAGAVATATVPLPPGTNTLYVEVGGAGVGGGARAFNGGGSGAFGAGGGGASDVRTVSTDDPASLASRLVVGGGGGGGPMSPNCFDHGGAAGDTSVPGPGNGGIGTDNCEVTPATAGHDGGFGGTTGGTGGTGGTTPGTSSCTGGDGALGQGGDAVFCIASGGGGGGGYYGGGAGGGGEDGAGGGGAGSSFWASDATGTSLRENTPPTTLASVTISYSLANSQGQDNDQGQNNNNARASTVTLGLTTPPADSVRAACLPAPAVFIQFQQDPTTPYFVPAGGGMITIWSTNTTGDTPGATLTFVVLSPNSDGTYTVVGTDTETLPNPLPSSGVATFNLSTPIAAKAGDTLGLYDATGTQTCFFSNNTTAVGDTIGVLGDSTAPSAGQTLTLGLQSSLGATLDVAATLVTGASSTQNGNS